VLVEEGARVVLGVAVRVAPEGHPDHVEDTGDGARHRDPGHDVH
jgi:hypothetical protein